MRGGVQSHKSSLELCHRDLVLLFWKVHLHGRQPQQDRSQHNPTFDKWLESHFNLQRRFHHSVLSRQQSPPVVESTTVSTNYKFNRRLFLFLFTKKKLRLSAKLYVLGLINAARFMLICRRGGVVIAKQGKRRKLFTTVVHIRKLTWKYCFIFCPIIFHMLSNYFPIQEHTQDPT